MARDYPRLDIKTFGEHLLRTNDLDPIYVALFSCGRHYDWDEAKIQRWMVAYWTFYHAGVACWMSDFEDGQFFWDQMMVAAINEDPTPTGSRWPRGAERRHCRGRQGIDCVARMRDQYPDPSIMVADIVGCGVALDVGTVMKRAQAHYLFGPWISFKVADMIDRVLGYHVDFDHGHMFMFKDPVKAALMLWRQHNKLGDNAKPKDQSYVLELVVANLSAMFMTHTAPPLHDRPVGFQEIETILCKWKSHMNGHYPLWNDIDEINHGIDPWTTCSEAAAAFAVAMPKNTTKEQTTPQPQESTQ